jgi:hypothetical protein
MADLVAELLTIARTLDAQRIEFAVCGGLAVAIHGHVRATRDIDLLLPNAARAPALDALKTIGFGLPAAPMVFGAGTIGERHVQRVSKAAGRELVTVDLILVEPAFVEVWASRQRFARDATQLTVVSADGLIAMKRLAGRKQDLADIEALERGADDE